MKRVNNIKVIPNRERLIFALDLPSQDEALQMVDKLGDAVDVYKLGLEMFLSGGYFQIVDALLHRGKKVFADLKLFDVPATVGRCIRQLNGRGISFVTVHGNDGILKAAAAAREGDLKILAVTALTSLDRGDLDDLGFSCDVAELVLSRARRALASGCDGVISSGLEAAKLRASLGERLLVVTPGIRPVDNRPADDQKRVVTVETAFAHGADYIVVGRPIRDAVDPRAAAEAIQQQIVCCF